MEREPSEEELAGGPVSEKELGNEAAEAADDPGGDADLEGDDVDLSEEDEVSPA